MHAIHSVALTVLGAIPNPGEGEAPPGSEHAVTILKWGAWVAFAVCVIGVMVAGGKMAIGSRRGEGGEHAAALGWVLAACVIIGSASAIVGALV